MLYSIHTIATMPRRGRACFFPLMEVRMPRHRTYGYRYKADAESDIKIKRRGMALS